MRLVRADASARVASLAIDVVPTKILVMIE